MIREDLLKILVCPESHQPLRELTTKELEDLNLKIEQGRVTNRAGQALTDKLDGALLRQDGHFAYPIRNQLPVMLIAEGIPME
jgi:uncharacterized protein YbaR (Trm112 family)